jgi:hypothetical protein
MVFLRKGGGGFCVLVFLFSYFAQTEGKWVNMGKRMAVMMQLLLGFPHLMH